MTSIPTTFKPSSGMLSNKVILVTGATGGFGAAISRGLASYGATVILLARSLRKVEALYDEIEKSGDPLPAIYPMDLEGASENDYADLAKNIESELTKLDGIIHCAATLGSPTVFAQSDAEAWYRVHQINLHAPYFLTRACLPLLKQSTLKHASKGSVVFMVDDKTGAYWDAYQVSKQALVAMSALLAREYADSKLHFNAYNPGKTRTALQLRAFPAADENDSLPTPNDHLNAFLYLASDELHQQGQIFNPQPLKETVSP